jgi:hypothetical protein
MAEDQKAQKEEFKSSRTELLQKMPKNFMQEMATNISKKLDDMGMTQEKQYQNKTKEELTVKKAKGGMVSSASKRADGCATKGKTRGRMV